MGELRQTKCKSCGHQFGFIQGGTISAEQFRCDRCGETKMHPRDEVGSASAKCACGGKYKKDAPPRCPKCKSKRIRKGMVVMYVD